MFNKSRQNFIALIIVSAIFAFSLGYIIAVDESLSKKPDLSFSHPQYTFEKSNFLEEDIKDSNIYKAKISFIFKLNSYHNHDNIFEILSDAEHGMRMEFSSEHALAIIWGQGDDISRTIIKEDVELGEEHEVNIKYYKGKIDLSIDGKRIKVNQPKQKISFKKITVGYGFDKERYFNGSIKDFEVQFFARKMQYMYILYALVSAFFIIFLILLVKSISLSELLPKFTRRSLLVTSIFSLILLVIAIYSTSAINSFLIYKKATGTNGKLDASGFMFLLKNELNKDYHSLSAKPLNDSSDIPSFFITINNKYIKKLNSNLPKSGRDKGYKGYIKIDKGKTLKMKMRYRGDSVHHYLFKQKSLRINLKDDLYNMEKKFNLINPPFIGGFKTIPDYQAAKKLGIISPDNFPVKVFINGEYLGVYLYVSQVDESLLRKHKLMPGSIYYGDFGAPINEFGYSDLWFNSKYWSKKSSRNEEQKDNRDDIDLFINKVNDPSEINFYKFFNQYINKPIFYNYNALDRVTGSYQRNISHNHKIYFDPYKGKFEFIEWDLRFWMDQGRKDDSYYPLLHRVNMNPILSYELDKATYKLYEDDLMKELYDVYKESVVKSKNALEADKYKDTAIYKYKVTDDHLLFNQTYGISYSVPYDYKEQLKTVEHDYDILKKRKNTMLNFFEKTDVKLVYFQQNNKLILKYYVGGNSAIKIDFSKLRGKISRLYNGNNIAIEGSEDILYAGRKVGVNTLQIDVWGDKKALEAYEEYTYVIGGNDINLDDISYKNAVTGSAVSPEIVKDFKSTADSIHPWKLLPPNPQTIELSGNVYIDQDKLYQEHQSVIIKPGTKFYIAPKKSLFFYGKVIAKGTKSHPIIFTRKSKDTPWGSIVVQGKKANGSVFDNIEVIGGSITKHNLIQYTAQFNIHDNDNFVIENCTFSKNTVGDDNVHIAYSKGIINSSIFSDSNSDALDIDISDIEANDNIFINSGNDGLDVMTTTLKAKNNMFVDNGDKGLSIGEWSNAEIKDSIILNAFIGIASKDKSRVNLENVLFVKNKSETITAYNKNSKYDEGGFIDGEGIFIIGNDKISADKKSEINIIESDTMPQIKNSGWFKNISKLPKNKQKILLNLQK